MLPTRSCLPIPLSVELKDLILSFLREQLVTVMKKSIQQYFVEGAWSRERRNMDYRTRKNCRLLSLRRSMKDCASAFIVACGKSQQYELYMTMTNQDWMEHCIFPSKIPVCYRNNHW